MKRKPNLRRIIYTNIILILIIVLLSCTTKNEKPDPIPTDNPSNSAQKDDLNEIDPAHNGKGEADDNAENPASQTSPISPDPNYSQQEPIIDSEFGASINLPYFKTENTERYRNYMTSNPALSVEQVIINVNIGLDNPFYVMIKPVENATELTALVNKYHGLPDDFKPELVQLDSSMCVPGTGNQYLRKEAADAFIELHETAKKQNMNITAYGTYRSIETQTNIWNNAVNSGRTVEDVDSLNARGGHSEHNLGLAVDVIKNNYSMMDTKEYEWYLDQIHKFGFILRYPEGKEHITGYNFEPWHLRYVGVEVATDVYNSGLTYEEYYVTVLDAK